MAQEKESVRHPLLIIAGVALFWLIVIAVVAFLVTIFPPYTDHEIAISPPISVVQTNSYESYKADCQRIETAACAGNYSTCVQNFPDINFTFCAVGGVPCTKVDMHDITQRDYAPDACHNLTAQCVMNIATKCYEECK
jgi:hypothetical protein